MDGPITGFRHRPVWLAALLALFAAQGWLTLEFLGAIGEPARLFGEEPIVTGHHPLHAYHARLGAERRREAGTANCYDPAFQAGYPKTPVFDGDSRPAELALSLFPEARPERAYKIGLALTCLLVPMLVVLAARGFGVPPAGACFAGAMGMLLWWSEPVRGAAVHGDLRYPLAGLCAAVHLGWQVRFAHWAGLDSWAVLSLSAAAGWLIDPVSWGVTAVAAVACYLWVAWRQELTWHLAWLAAGTFGVLVNAFWLWDWLRFSWICPPLTEEEVLALGRASEMTGRVGEVMAATPGWPAVAAVGVAAVAGALTLSARKRFGIAALLAAGVAFPVLVGTAATAAFAFAACAAGFALCRLPGRAKTAVVLSTVALVGIYCGSGERETPRIGLSPAELALVQGLRDGTAPTARILWEEADEDWSPLLPVLTGRAFLGGLAPGVEFDHQFARLSEGELAGRPVTDWSDDELSRFFRRYNVGWVVCHSPASIERIGRHPAARPAPIPAADRRRMFTLDREHAFVLAGSGDIERADHHRLVLANVVPSPEGEVVLSFHHQAGMKVEPGYIDAEADQVAFLPLDPVPLIRLRTPGPVPRLVISWNAP